MRIGGLGLRRDIPMEEVRQHASKDDCWMVLSGRVYNITPYMAFHPGGCVGHLGSSSQGGGVLRALRRPLACHLYVHCFV